MKNLLIIMLILSVSYSCTNESITIKINDESNNNHAFEVRIINSTPLETNNVSLINSISKLLYENHIFYIYDFYNKSILSFSDSSKFLFSLNSGRGPGEVLNPTDIVVNDSSLFVIDQSKIMRFDLQGNFMDDIKFKSGLFCWKFDFVQQSNLLLYGNSPSINEIKKMGKDQSISKIENILTQYKIVDTTLSNEIKTFCPVPFNLRMFLCQKPTSIFEDHLLCLSPPYNYIYELKNQEMNIKYKIDFGDKGFTNDDIGKGEQFLIKQLSLNKRCGCLDYINETKEFISFGYVKEYGRHSYIVFSKETHTTADFSDILSQLGLSTAEPIATNGDNFLCVVHPTNITAEERNKVSLSLKLPIKIDENSNPIIIEIKLSENI
jgi:hypothetical protein